VVCGWDHRYRRRIILRGAPMNMLLLNEIRNLAKKYGWAEIDHQKNIKMISFSDMACRINVYYSRGTVATVLEHPKLGRQTLYRRSVRLPQLSQIFENPRVHSRETGLVGYHKAH